MPGPRVVTRVTLSRAPLNKCIHENVTVAAEGSVAHRHLEEIQCEKRSVLLSSAIPSLYSLGCCRHAQGLPSRDAIPPHAGLRGMRVQRCHSGARRPARPAHRALLETCALHRASLHCAASPCGSPSLLSLPAASGQREGSQSACAVLLVACHCLPISRDVEYLLWTDPPSPGCAASLASRRPALGHTSATLQPHTAPAQQPAVPCTFVPLLPPTSGSLSHSWPASVRPLRR